MAIIFNEVQIIIENSINIRVAGDVCIKIYLLPFLVFIMTALLLISQADASACSVGGCGGGDDSWTASAQSFINSDAPIVGLTQNQNAGPQFQSWRTCKWKSELNPKPHSSQYRRGICSTRIQNGAIPGSSTIRANR